MKLHKSFVLHGSIHFIQSQQHVVVHDFTEFNINAKHFQLFEGKSKKPRLFCEPAKNLRGLAPVRGPAVENH